MLINEVTTPYNNPYDPETDIGLMTRKEFLAHRNASGKMHDSGSYVSTVDSFNAEHPEYRHDISFLATRGQELYLLKFSRGWVMTDAKPSIYSTNLERDTVIAVVIGDVAYYNRRFSKNYLPVNFETYRGDKVQVEPKKYVIVKYLDKYIDQLVSRTEANRSDFPVVLKRFRVGEEHFTVRMKKKPTKKDSGSSIAILNSEDKIVAYASDEYGATLLRVAQEYRGLNLGKILGDIWYRQNPGYPSGGFSPSGQKNAIRIWENRVREFLSNGWYSSFVQSGELTAERVKEIVSQLPERKVVSAPKKIKPQPLFYSDGNSVFVVYDKQFLSDQDEKYIYAFGFLRDSGGKVFAHTLDYDPTYKKLATVAIVQLSQDGGDRLFIGEKPSDIIELDGIPEVKQEDGYAYLDQKMLDIPQLIAMEKKIRKPLDPHGEILQLILEFAHSKW